jgi:hypothetical protein
MPLLSPPSGRGFQLAFGGDDGGAPRGATRAAAAGAGGVRAPAGSLSGVQLLFITYACVCGGPFGIEPVVRVMGPRLTLIGLATVPAVWSLQEALMCAQPHGRAVRARACARVAPTGQTHRSAARGRSARARAQSVSR